MASDHRGKDEKLRTLESLVHGGGGLTPRYRKRYARMLNDHFNSWSLNTLFDALDALGGPSFFEMDDEDALEAAKALAEEQALLLEALHRYGMGWQLTGPHKQVWAKATEPDPQPPEASVKLIEAMWHHPLA